MVDGIAGGIADSIVAMASAGASIRAPHAAVSMRERGGRRGGGMIWRSRIRPWIAAAIGIVLAGGLFWMAVKQAEQSAGTSSSALGEAMSKAAHQRVLTP